MLSEVSLGSRKGESDVELGESDVDVQVGKALDGSDVLVERGVVLGDEMGLESNTVNLDALGAQVLDELLNGLGLLAGGLKVVVVIVELGLGGDSCRRLKGEVNVLGAQRLVEDGLAICPVLLKRFVDDVPGVALVLPVPSHLLDVVDDGGAHGVGGPSHVADPETQLAVPHQSMASEDLTGLLGVLRHNLALGVVEDALLGLGEQPLLVHVSSASIFPPESSCLTFMPLVGVVDPNSPDFHMISSYFEYEASRPARSRWPGESVAEPKYSKPACFA